MTWTTFATTTKSATIGRATEVLHDAPDPFVWDELGSVNVQLLNPSHSLNSETEEALLSGANMGMLGDEMIQWQHATLEDDGTYTLSRLIRGRQGSDWACDSHALGEDFVVLDVDRLLFVPMDIGYLDQRAQFRTTSVGMPTAGFLTREFNIRFRNLRPLSPQHASGARDVSGNLTITWIRRTRFGGAWRDGRDASLGEISEVYELDVYDGSTLVRAVSGLIVPSYEYMAADQTTDFGSAQSAVNVDIYQISNTVGRGFGTRATV